MTIGAPSRTKASAATPGVVRRPSGFVFGYLNNAYKFTPDSFARRT